MSLMRAPCTSIIRSHPTGVRGLKFSVGQAFVSGLEVAPHWGAWIEIRRRAFRATASRVAPHWGAWIEINIPALIAVWVACRTPLGCVD